MTKGPEYKGGNNYINTPCKCNAARAAWPATSEFVKTIKIHFLTYHQMLNRNTLLHFIQFKMTQNSYDSSNDSCRPAVEAGTSALNTMQLIHSQLLYKVKCIFSQ